MKSRSLTIKNLSGPFTIDRRKMNRKGPVYIYWNNKRSKIVLTVKDESERCSEKEKYDKVKVECKRPDFRFDVKNDSEPRQQFMFTPSCNEGFFYISPMSDPDKVNINSLKATETKIHAHELRN